MTSDDEEPKPSAHRFRLLRYGPDRGELIGGQRLLGKQQAAAFVEVLGDSALKSMITKRLTVRSDDNNLVKYWSRLPMC